MINMSYSIFYSFVFILYVLSLQSYSSESLLHPSGRLWPSPPHSPRPVAASTWSLLSSLLFQVKKNTSEDDESIDGRQGNKKSLWGRLLQRKTAKSSPSANNESDSNTAECNSEGGSSSSKEGGNSTATSPTDTNSERSSHADEEDDQDDPSSPQVISVAEMQTALSNANNILSSPPDHITALGWKLVHNREHEDVAINATRRFSLYKRRKDVKDGGSVEYLMTGEFSDISPVSFLSVQLDQAYRKQWDSTMKDMSVGEILLVKLLGRSVDSVGEEENDDLPICNPYTATLKVIKDVLYYRTKWPWPMKDRDYVLARRCRIFDANNSMVLVSRSIENPSYPAIDGVIRVDNYVCHTAVVSTDGASPSPPSNRQNEPGSSSDSNQDTPLPPGSEVYRHENNVRYIEEMIQKMEKLQQRHQRQLIQLRYVSAIPDPQHETSPKLLPISSVELISRQKLFIYKLTHPKFKIKSKMLQEAMLRWKNKLQPPIPEQPPSDGTNMDAAIEKGLSNLESINPEDVIATEQNCKPRIIRTNTLLKPGMKFVTIFCDDNKVPLHPRIVDMLSAQGEKVVPDSMLALHTFAKGLEKRQKEAEDKS